MLGLNPPAEIETILLEGDADLQKPYSAGPDVKGKK